MSKCNRILKSRDWIMSGGIFKPSQKYEFNKKEKGICVSDRVRFIVSDKVRMLYNMFLDITMHKTVGPIQFNCENKKAIQLKKG